MASPIHMNGQLPFSTADLEGIGGQIKCRDEDFFVEEIPLYEPSGQGDHSYLQIEKKGLSTMEAMIRLGRALKRPHQQIGYAGLKDARAVTRQWLSLEHLDPDLTADLVLPNVTVMQISRHQNKLKMGHLKANRFRIKVRHIDIHRIGNYENARKRAEAILANLVNRGVPNFFGPQRFGKRYDSHLLGGTILFKNYDQFIDMMLGLPDSDVDSSVEYVARSFYEQNEWQKAYDAWPDSHQQQRRVLRSLMRASDKGTENPKKIAFNNIDRNLKRLFVSAFQSDLFNQVLAARMPCLNVLLDGDLAWKHDNGACFKVENAAKEQSRCDQFEISPSGPLFGYRMAEPTGRPHEIEQEVLQQSGLTPADFRVDSPYKVKGGRRPLRFYPAELDLLAGQDVHGEFIQLCFELPPGCYATTLLREIIK